VRMGSFFKTDTPVRTVTLFHAGKSENWIVLRIYENSIIVQVSLYTTATKFWRNCDEILRANYSKFYGVAKQSVIFIDICSAAWWD
jgi:hypothetical protein